MTENGDPLENAITERVNGIIKNEWIDKAHLQSWGKTMKYVEKVIGLYNKKRPHTYQALDLPYNLLQLESNNVIYDVKDLFLGIRQPYTCRNNSSQGELELTDTLSIFYLTIMPEALTLRKN
ncbi:MAG: integrase core domain-containing protein [Alistipes indistinctus]